MYYFAIEKQLEGIFNAVSPHPVSNQELTKVIAKTLKKPLWLPNIPEFVMNLILGEMSYLLFSSKNLSSIKITNSGFQFQFPKIDKAINDLYA
jgi:NAD dependent epimerase/dehydratase family enzyme